MQRSTRATKHNDLTPDELAQVRCDFERISDTIQSHVPSDQGRSDAILIDWREQDASAVTLGFATAESLEV